MGVIVLHLATGHLFKADLSLDDFEKKIGSLFAVQAIPATGYGKPVWVSTRHIVFWHEE